MKRIYYVSRCSKALQPKELKAIQTASLNNNPRNRITSFLVCLGDTFFQVIEGPKKSVDALFFDKITHDPRHHDVLCLKSEPDAGKRMFPNWHMKVFDLNTQGDTLPFAFQQMLTALLESHYVIAQYTQPTVFQMLAKGVNPTSLQPQRKKATVFFSDIIGFSLFSQWLAPRELIELATLSLSAKTCGPNPELTMHEISMNETNVAHSQLSREAHKTCYGRRSTTPPRYPRRELRPAF